MVKEIRVKRGVMYGWLFLLEDGQLRIGSRETAEVGKTYRMDPPLRRDKRGLRAFGNPLDALSDTAGPTACRVLLTGEILRDKYGSCSTELTVLRMVDATRTLHEFTIWRQERELRRVGVTDKRAWNALRVKRLWLNGQATEKEVYVAWWEAWNAIWGADENVVRELYDAWDVAWNAAGKTAWNAERGELGQELTKRLRLLGL